MQSKAEKLGKSDSDNPFANARTLEEREEVWAALKKVAKPISKEEFLKKLKEAGSK
ncbi:hypothetical protein [Algoriphagus sp.]|uniref:hypothetical protein n=1 Tax=Algoriphagus sp. TaxID=1872435 RepID=UPI00391DE35A